MNRPILRSFLPLASALAAALLLAAAPARAYLKTIELSIETTSAETRIPDHAPASLLLSICDKTCPQSLAVTAKTVCFIGRKPVSLRDVHNYAVNHRVSFTLFYDPTTKELNRIQADE